MRRGLAALGVAVLLAGCQAREETRAPAPATDSSAGDHDTARGPIADSTAVRAVVGRYYAAIEARDFHSAYAYWARSSRAGRQTYDEFARGFAETAHTQVEFAGPVSFEGAAGSIFATVPVRVHATTTAGEEGEFTGEYQLRRANDVPGATAEQLEWHFHDAQLEELTPGR